MRPRLSDRLLRAPIRGAQARRGRSPQRAPVLAVVASWLYATGLVGVLCGAVLPWIVVDRTVWSFDLSLWWTLTGRPGLASLPPSTGACVVVIALVLAVPVIFAGRLPSALASAVAGGLLGVMVLSVVRAAAVGQIHVGLAVSVAGAIALSAGSLLQAG